MKTLKALPDLIGRKKVGAEEVASDLVTGSWRRLVFAHPGLPHGVVDKAAYSFCVLEHPHRSLRRRDVFARDGDRWGDPRAKPPAGARWTAAEPKVLTALGLESEPAGHLADLASALHAAYVQVAAGQHGVGGGGREAELDRARGRRTELFSWVDRSRVSEAGARATSPGSPAHRALSPFPGTAPWLGP